MTATMDLSGTAYADVLDRVAPAMLPVPRVLHIGSWSGAIVLGVSSLATPTVTLGDEKKCVLQQFSMSSSGISAPFSVVYGLENPPAEQRLATNADRVRWIHEHTGLTWDQLGRLFGVSRRTVHLWAGGARLNATNAETLGEVEHMVRSLDGVTPDERRSTLFKLDDKGFSLFDRFLHYRRSDVTGINSHPWRALDLLGATDEESTPTA